MIGKTVHYSIVHLKHCPYFLLALYKYSFSSSDKPS